MSQAQATPVNGDHTPSVSAMEGTRQRFEEGSREWPSGSRQDGNGTADGRARSSFALVSRNSKPYLHLPGSWR